MKQFAGIKALTKKLAEKKNITQKESEEIIKDVVDVLKDVFTSDEFSGVQLVDFLTLEKVVRAERMGRNPRTKEPILIPSKKDIKAKVGSAFAKELNK